MAKSHVLKAKRVKMERDRKGIQKSDNSHVSLFDHILDSDMPETERSDDRLTGEAQILLLAGTGTTSRTLDLISYYILANPSIHSRLQDELKDTMAAYPQHVPSLAELERLPYLQAIIKEGLRSVKRVDTCLNEDFERRNSDEAVDYSLGYAVMRRLPRCSPDVPIQYKQWTIPIGVRRIVYSRIVSTR